MDSKIHAGQRSLIAGRQSYELLLRPEYWNEWYPAIRDELLGKLSGAKWNDSRVGSEFATAMCCIILQIPYNYVPVFAP